MQLRNSDDAILDAARQLVLTQGLSRTTLTDVAREAGLSRMTVYRRWERLPQLLGAMMQREWDGLLAPTQETFEARLAAADHTRELLVGELVRSIATLRGSELLRGILAVEPQILLPYLVERPGRMHGVAHRVAVAGIERGQADGSIIGGDSDLLATTVVMAAQSWLVSMNAAGTGHDPAALDEQLGRLLDAYLRPPA